MSRHEFFATRGGVAMTFDDVTLQTKRSHVPFADIDVTGRFSRGVELATPFVSAAMDTVTTSPMAIAMGKLGGLGIIHAGLDVEAQYREVRAVKYALNGCIEKPITVTRGMTLGSVLARNDKKGWDFHTMPVIDSNGRFEGLITGNDFDMFGISKRVSSVMTLAEETVTAPAGTTVKEAHRIMCKTKKRKLPLLNQDGTLAGLYVWSDVARIVNGNPEKYTLDKDDSLLTAAAVPTDETAMERLKRMGLLLDVVVLDSAQGDSPHSFETLQLIRNIKEEWPDLEVVVGNITDDLSAADLYRAGADGIKTGQGPGSICTTRRETGIGTPQVTAVYEDSVALEDTDVPVCADGGIVNHGDSIKAFAAGAESVMLGRALAGCDEAPSRLIEHEGQYYKEYRGMGSPSALNDSASARKRYGGSEKRKPRPEGIESLVPYTGSLEDTIGAFRDFLQKGLSYTGSQNLAHLRDLVRWWQVTGSGAREARPHDVLPLPKHGLRPL